tara:strand:+ start:637 stop:978 length:342 start_codon:yes stop_codon:yes gene_type:complete
MKRIIIAALLTCLVTPALAAGAQGQYNVKGIGNYSCGKWTAERKDKSLKGTTYVTWITGYLTSYNNFTPGVVDISKGTDVAGLSAWVDNYCGANPLNDIADASNALVQHLKAR